LKKILSFILLEKIYINISALEMASPRNRYCANCIGALSFPIGCVKERLQKSVGVKQNQFVSLLNLYGNTPVPCISFFESGGGHFSHGPRSHTQCRSMHGRFVKRMRMAFEVLKSELSIGRHCSNRHSYTYTGNWAVQTVCMGQ